MAFWAAAAPALISAAGSIGGALISRGGGGGDNSGAENFAREQLNFQREAARHSIRWRVADAKESGVHPLFALGAPSFSPSPVPFHVGGDSSGVDWGGALSGMSQGVARAIAATQSKGEREASPNDPLRPPGYTERIAQQQIELNDINLEMARRRLAADGALLRGGQVGPGLPSSVVGKHEMEPSKVLEGQPDPAAAQATAGPQSPSITWKRLADGRVQANPDKESNMDDFSSPGYSTFMWDNRVRPIARPEAHKPPDHMLPKGAVDWVFEFPGVWRPISLSEFSHRKGEYYRSPMRGNHPTHGYTWGVREPTSLKLPPRY